LTSEIIFDKHQPLGVSLNAYKSLNLDLSYLKCLG